MTIPLTIEVLGISNLEDGEFLEKVLSTLVKGLDKPEEIKINLRVRPEDLLKHIQNNPGDNL